MAEYWYKFELEHTGGNGRTEQIRVTTKKPDKNHALGKAFSKLAGKYGYSSVSIAESEWAHTGPTWRGFEDNPWNDYTDIKNEFESYAETDKVVAQPPYTEKYTGPPKVFIFTNNGDEQNVKRKVQKYYDGLTVATEPGKVEVIVSATTP